MIGAEDVRVVLLKPLDKHIHNSERSRLPCSRIGIIEDVRERDLVARRPTQFELGGGEPTRSSFARVLFLKGYSRYSATAVKNGASADVGEVPLNNWTRVSWLDLNSVSLSNRSTTS
jgi:hypothetical protein